MWSFIAWIACALAISGIKPPTLSPAPTYPLLLPPVSSPVAPPASFPLISASYYYPYHLQKGQIPPTMTILFKKTVYQESKKKLHYLNLSSSVFLASFLNSLQVSLCSSRSNYDWKSLPQDGQRISNRDRWKIIWCDFISSSDGV